METTAPILFVAVFAALVGLTWWYARSTGRVLNQFREQVAGIQQQATANSEKLQSFQAQILEEIKERQQVEHRLKESEARFTAFMQHLPGTAMIRDAGGRCRFANAAWETLFEGQPEDWQARDLHEVWPADLAERALDLDRRVLASGQPLETVETTERYGQKHFWLTKRFPIPNPNDQGMAIGAVGIDITDRRQTEEALSQEKERYRILAEESPLGLAIISKNGTYKYLNPTFVSMFGFTLAEVPHGRAWFERAFPNPEYRRQAMTAWMNDSQPSYTGPPRPRTFKVTCKDGFEKFINFRAVTLSSGDHFVIYEDISGRYRAQEELKRSEFKYRTLMNQIPAVVFKGYADWSVEFFDRKIEELAGYAPEEFNARRLKWSDIILEEDLQQTKEVLKEALKTTQSYVREYRIRIKNGEIRWLQSRGQIICRPDGKIDYITGVFFDITKQKETEEALQAERNRLETITRHMGAGLAVIDPDYQIVWANQVLKEASGNFEGMHGHTALQLSQEICSTYGLQGIFTAGREKVVHETHVEDSHGNQVWSEIITTPIHGDRGEVTAALQLVIPITERKRAEEALRQSENLYRLLAENVRDVIWTVSLDREVTFVSPSAQLLSGYSPEEIKRKRFDELVTAASLDVAEKTFTEAMSSIAQEPQDRGRTWTLEAEMICQDGTTLWTEVKASFLWDAEGQPVGILGVSRDISKRKNAEMALRRRESILAAVSFAAGRFLQTESWESDIQEILERLGQAVMASRAYIFENHGSENGDILTSQRYEWAAPGLPPQIDNPALQNLSWRDAGFQRWEEELSHGRLLAGHVREFPPLEQELLRAQDIKSVLVVPIFTGLDWWGFIGFDECHQEREWSTVELEALKTAASTLGAAILSERAETALKESENKLRSLSCQLLDAQEHERKRLAVELHDELGHALLTLKLRLESLEVQLLPQQVSLKRETAEIIRFLLETIDEVRRLYLDLSPGDLEDLGLTNALEALIEDFAALQKSIQYKVHLENLDGLFELPVQTAIYRVVQEALTNIGKHAEAGEISLAISKDSKLVSFTIADNGKGFDMSDVLVAKKSLGLLAMEERVKILGGSFSLWSQKDQGTKVSFNIPLTQGGN
jgi:PAS domain S-box-containing protein